MDPKDLETILLAGLYVPSGRGAYPCDLILVDDPGVIKKLAGFKTTGANMLETATAAIVVIGDTQKSSMVLEDGSVIMTQMHLMASSLGIGSCWVHAAGGQRMAHNGQDSQAYLRELLAYPTSYEAVAILSLGLPVDSSNHVKEPPLDKIHRNHY